MESSSQSVPFPLLKDPSTYDPCTIKYRTERDDPAETTAMEKTWLQVFRKSIPGFKKRAENDDSVTDAAVRAQKFADRFGGILDAWEKSPESNGGPPNCVLLCRLRDVCLREVGFEDIFKKVKAEENEKAIALLPEVLKSIDAIEDPQDKVEHIVKGMFAGNIFDLGAPGSAELFESGRLSFKSTYDKLHPRPWVVDDFDKFKAAFLTKKWKKAVIFCDNAGADVILGILPFARELLRKGTKVVLAVNEIPSINDITYPEMLDIISQVENLVEFQDKPQSCVGEMAVGADSGSLVVVTSGSDLPVADLSCVSPELAYVAEGADLVVMEGMGRSIETNLYTRFSVDSVSIGMVKHQEVADFLGGRLYDCVIKYTEV